LKLQLEQMNNSADRAPKEINEEVAEILKAAGYSIVIQDYDRPWGGFNQLDNKDANRFIEEFFPELTPNEARLGNSNSELSPKILVVVPKQRLSWQYHDRRAERWAYITQGGYFKSLSDDQGDMQFAEPGDVVQFQKSERHRLVGANANYTIVAEIWQHTDPSELSNESDIVRLDDDYSR
jgi:mannose-6-phosphate isomerase-like protein (cupin superfamily)